MGFVKKLILSVIASRVSGVAIHKTKALESTFYTFGVYLSLRADLSAWHSKAQPQLL